MTNHVVVMKMWLHVVMFLKAMVGSYVLYAAAAAAAEPAAAPAANEPATQPIAILPKICSKLTLGMKHYKDILNNNGANTTKALQGVMVGKALM